MKKLITLILIALTHQVVMAQLTVDASNGYVGVNTSSPAESLTVSGNTLSNNFGTNYLIFSDQYEGTLSSDIDKNGIRWQAPNQSIFGTEKIRFYQLYNYAQDKLFFDDDSDYSNGTNLTIERSGDIGIGVTDPLNKLHVNGDVLIESGAGNFKFGFPTGNGWGLSTTGAGSTLYLNSYSNTSTETGTNVRTTFLNDGKVGIGTTNPQKMLHASSSIAGGALRLTRLSSSCIFDAGSEINEAFLGTSSNHPLRILTNNSVRMQISANGNIGIGTISPNFPLEVIGDAYISGDLTVASDLIVKRNIQPIQQALSMINAMNPVQYYYKNDEFPNMKFSQNKKLGLIAQELEVILPNLVSSAGTAKNINNEVVSVKSINYLELIPLLVKAVQEQQNEIDLKNNELSSIRDEVNLLKHQMEILMKHLGENGIDIQNQKVINKK